MRAFVILLFCLLPTWSLAEPVVVKAGEHGTFTRLVLEFDDRPSWSMRNLGNGYRLRFDRIAPLSFDFSRVYRLIDRSRVRDIRAIGNNAIEIDLACRCALEVASSGERALVVDIHQPSELAPTAQADMSAMPRPVDPDTEPVVSETAGDHAPSWAPPDFPGFPDVIRSRPAPVEESRSGIEPDFSPPVQGSSFAVEAMANALSRAAAQGLVSAAPDIRDRMADQRPPGQGSRDVSGNIAVSTGFDRAIPSTSATLSPTDLGAVCIQNADIDVAAWGDAGDPTMHGRLRGEAIAEDGSVDVAGAKRLARFYINMGFGAEARGTAQFLPASRDRAVIEALAEIVDHGRSDADLFDGQVGCDGAVSLWATLAAPLSPGNMPRSTDHLLSTFSALPSHLRNLLGPLLSERLHSAGLDEDAHTAMNAVTRAGITSDESELANARLGLEGTQAAAARDVLSDLSNGTDETAAAALLELLEDAEARGMAPNPAWVDDAPTLVGALEGTEIAEKLNLAGLRGLIALGRFDDFRTAVVEDSPGLTQTIRRSLSRRAMRAAEQRADDRDFITAEIGLSKLMEIEETDRDLRYAIASRLAKIGLASRAVAYLPDVPRTREELTTTTGILVAAGQTSEAIALSSGPGFEGADGLLASALVAAGQDGEAIAHFLAAGDVDGAEGSAVRTGDWGWITEHGVSPVADAAATLISETLGGLDVVDTPNGALIEASRLRRENARALLEYTTPGASAPAFTN